MVTRMPYPFPIKTCPNREWHGEVARLCPMCGASGPAYRFGERLAPLVVVGFLAGVILAVVLKVSGAW